MGRFTHIRWNDLKPGTILDGTLLPSRTVAGKNGDSYMLAELEHKDGQRTGFTAPIMLKEKLKDISVGTRIRIRFDGEVVTTNARRMFKFSVRRVAASEGI